MASNATVPALTPALRRRLADTLHSRGILALIKYRKDRGAILEAALLAEMKEEGAGSLLVYQTLNRDREW